jgi:hypothetical protein
MTRKAPAERLRQKLVEVGDCLVWIGASHNGYGMINVGYKNERPYRLAWELENGDIPPSYHIHHKCKNPACCNVEHLELLSATEHYERHAPARLAPEDLSQYDVDLKELEDWLTPAEAGRVMGMSKQAASKRLEQKTLRGVKTHQGWLVDPKDAERVARERRSPGPLT